jgi:hypothetical protein
LVQPRRVAGREVEMHLRVSFEENTTCRRPTSESPWPASHLPHESSDSSLVVPVPFVRQSSASAPRGAAYLAVRGFGPCTSRGGPAMNSARHESLLQSCRLWCCAVGAYSDDR